MRALAVVFLLSVLTGYSQTASEIQSRLKDGEVAIFVKKEQVTNNIFKKAEESAFEHDGKHWQYYYMVYTKTTEGRVDVSLEYNFYKWVSAYLKNCRKFNITPSNSSDKALAAWDNFWANSEAILESTSVVYFEQLWPIEISPMRVMRKPVDGRRLEEIYEFRTMDELFFDPPEDGPSDNSFSLSGGKLMSGGTEITSLSRLISSYDQKSTGLQCFSCCQSSIYFCENDSYCGTINSRPYRRTTSSFNLVSDEPFYKLGVGLFKDLYLSNLEIHASYIQRRREMIDNNGRDFNYTSPLLHIE